jgi:hypothetical protein
MNLSVEHVLSIMIIVFLLYHFVGRCQCRDGFSVGGQSASPTCKCRDLDINNKCPSIKDAKAWGFDQLTCTNYTTNASCLHSTDGPESICIWNNSLCRPGIKSGGTLQYTFDLSSLNLNPINGTVTYEIKYENWTNTANGKEPALLFLSDTQLGVLNCLQEQLKIRYIGVDKKGEWPYDYRVLLGVNAGKKGVDLYFYDDTRDDYTLSIDETSVLIHDVNYNSKIPTIIHLLANIDNFDM